MSEIKRLVKIGGSTLVEISNDSFSIVGYNTDKIKRDFPVGAKRQISLDEIEDVMNVPGGEVLFKENLLLIKDGKVREHLGLPALDEFNLTREQIRTLLATGDEGKLEEVLQFCTDPVLNKIVQESLDMKITSFAIAGLIKAYSGTDVLQIIKEKMEEKPVGSTKESEDKTRLAQARKPLNG